MITDISPQWEFREAKYYKKIINVDRTIRVVVMHDMEAPETGTTAESVANYFQHPDTESSAHLCIDNNSIIRCVHDKDIAYAAPGCNSDGLQIEMAGYGSQTRGQWLDFYGIGLLALASDAAAQYCLRHNLPPAHITNKQLEQGQRGIIGHYQASEVYKKSTHTDPGKDFPWDYFINSVVNFYNARRVQS